MPQTPHVEKHFTASESVRDIVIGMSDGLTVPFALAARNQHPKVIPECGESCPAEVTVAAIGGRWKIFILWNLYRSKLRFSELRRKVEGISQKMVTEQLRQLEG
jgi:HxlR-like helix-turn-helix